MRTKLMGLAIAGAVFGLSIGAAQAGLYIIPNNGIVDQAEAEPLTNWPNPPFSGFPLGLNGRQHDAALVAAHAGDYRFTFLGSGNSTRFNTFTVLGKTFFSQSPGGPDHPTFVVTLAAGTVIPFTYTTATSSTAQPSCSISNGGNSTGNGEECHYLVALANGTDGSLASPDTVAYIGFSDLPGGTGGDQQIACVGDCDFQDLTVRVEQVPVPATLALLGAGLLGLGIARRRQSA